MSSKRKQLGFEEGSESESEVRVVQEQPSKKLKLLKVTLLKDDEPERHSEIDDEEEASKRPVLGKPVTSKDDGGDDYMNMIIKEDELTAPQRLSSKDGAEPTPSNFESITDRKNRALRTSLFGQIANSEADSVITPLPNDQPKVKSKGLSIMEKMGFKIGETLGPDSHNTSALLEPLITVQRTSKQGIKENVSNELNTEPKGATGPNEQQFRTRLNQENNDARLEKTVHKMQKYCYEFSGDADIDIQKHNPLDINVLWRGYVIHVQQLLKAKQETKGDQMDKIEPIDHEGDDLDGEDEELQIFNDLSWKEKVERLNLQLRSQYDYCFFCGAKYEDQKDLFENCPGETEEDHL